MPDSVFADAVSTQMACGPQPATPRAACHAAAAVGRPWPCCAAVMDIGSGEGDEACGGGALGDPAGAAGADAAAACDGPPAADGGIASTAADADAGSEEAFCCICLSGISPEPCATFDCCEHTFHSECLSRWVQVEALCPLCRREASSWSVPAATVHAGGAPAPAVTHAIDRSRRQSAEDEFDAADWIDGESDDDGDSGGDELADVVCYACGGGGDEARLLMCDGCPRAAHTYCHGLSAVPSGEWFCGQCPPAPAQRQRPPRRARQSHRASRDSDAHLANLRDAFVPTLAETSPPPSTRRGARRRAQEAHARTLAGALVLRSTRRGRVGRLSIGAGAPYRMHVEDMRAGATAGDGGSDTRSEAARALLAARGRRQRILSPNTTRIPTAMRNATALGGPGGAGGGGGREGAGGASGGTDVLLQTLFEQADVAERLARAPPRGRVPSGDRAQPRRPSQRPTLRVGAGRVVPRAAGAPRSSALLHMVCTSEAREGEGSSPTRACAACVGGTGAIAGDAWDVESGGSGAGGGGSNDADAPTRRADSQGVPALDKVNVVRAVKAALRESPTGRALEREHFKAVAKEATVAVLGGHASSAACAVRDAMRRRRLL